MGAGRRRHVTPIEKPARIDGFRLLTNPTFFGAWGFVLLRTRTEEREEPADLSAAQTAIEA